MHGDITNSMTESKWPWVINSAGRDLGVCMAGDITKSMTEFEWPWVINSAGRDRGACMCMGA